MVMASIHRLRSFKLWGVSRHPIDESYRAGSVLYVILMASLEFARTDEQVTFVIVLHAFVKETSFVLVNVTASDAVSTLLPSEPHAVPDAVSCKFVTAFVPPAMYSAIGVNKALHGCAMVKSVHLLKVH